jgi:formylglycine-generating enzyme required for sulfatase activity
VAYSSRFFRSALVSTTSLAVAACTGIIGLPDVPDLGLADADTSDVTAPNDGAPLDANASDARSDAKTTPDADAATDSGEGGISTQATSCAGRTGPGIDDCGPGSNGDCCESPIVSTGGGLFNRNFGPGAGTGSAPAKVSDFRLDKYEVSVARFRAFVAAVRAGYSPPIGSGKHSHLKDGSGASVGLALSQSESGYEQGWTYVISSMMNAFVSASMNDTKSTYAASPANERRPVNLVTWEEAYAFCIWDGGFLPSEAEWIFAAANGPMQLLWPWGNSANPSLSYLVMDFNYPAGNTKATSNTVNQIAPVGVPSLGVSKSGQFDMAGNLQEVVLDRPDTGFPNNQPGSCTDCTTFVGSQVVVRGGNYGDPPIGTTGSTVRGLGSNGRYDYQGFRCARSP